MRPISYVCSNPECGNELANEDALAAMFATPGQVAEYVDNKQTCNACDTHDLPTGVFVCENGGRTPTPAEVAADLHLGDPPDGYTHWSAAATIFDKVLEVSVAPKTITIKENGRDKEVTTKGLTFGTGQPWSSIEDDLKAYGVPEEDIAKMLEPMDLEARYAPDRKKKPADFGKMEDYCAYIIRKQAAELDRDIPSNWGIEELSPQGGWSNGDGGVRKFG